MILIQKNDKVHYFQFVVMNHAIAKYNVCYLQYQSKTYETVKITHKILTS